MTSPRSRPTATQHLDRLQRLAAEFDNYRKRVAREQESLVARANERLVKELLPCSTISSGRSRPRRSTRRRSSRTASGSCTARSPSSCAKQGLDEIETDGKFDPHVHEALLSQPSEAEEGSVLEVVQKGYRLGDRCCGRPAS